MNRSAELLVNITGMGEKLIISSRVGVLFGGLGLAGLIALTAGLVCAFFVIMFVSLSVIDNKNSILLSPPDLIIGPPTSVGLWSESDSIHSVNLEHNHTVFLSHDILSSPTGSHGHHSDDNSFKDL